MVPLTPPPPLQKKRGGSFTIYVQASASSDFGMQYKILNSTVVQPNIYTIA